MGWKKPGKMLLAEPPVQDECAHRIRFRPTVMVEVRRGGCSYTLIAGFLGVPASVDLTGVCALVNVGFCDHSDPRGLGQLPFTEPLGTFLIGAYGPASGRVVPHRCD